jgi:hypothetical protein
MQPSKFRMTTRAICLLVIAFVLSLVLLTQIGAMKPEASVTLSVATITAIVGWAMSTNMKARLDLELKASNEVMDALKGYSKAISNFNVAVSYPSTKFPPRPIPAHYWHDVATEHYQKLNEELVDFLTAQVAFRESIEANELALVELENYYRYIIMKHDEVTEKFQKISTDYVNNLDKATSQAGYDELVVMCRPMQKLLVDQVVLCFDLKKELLNKFQSRLFGRKVGPRKPLDGSKTLKELATRETVEAMVRRRDEEFLTGATEE